MVIIHESTFFRTFCKRGVKWRYSQIIGIDFVSVKILSMHPLKIVNQMLISQLNEIFLFSWLKANRQTKMIG